MGRVSMGKIKNKMFGTVFRVVENPHNQDAAIELLEGEWKGLVYQYGKVQMEDDTPNLNFQRTIRKVPDGMEKNELNLEELLNNNALNTLIGDILVELIESQIRKEGNEQRDIEGTD
jgi:hypothetical protein